MEQDWVQRMRTEHSDLDAKISKLEDFIFVNAQYKSLGMTEAILLRQQLVAMRSYREILSDRIGLAE